jgi:hypothetical protein
VDPAAAALEEPPAVLLLVLEAPPAVLLLVLEAPPAALLLVLEAPPAALLLVLEAPPAALLLVLEAPPLRSPINFWNAVLRLDSTLDDKPEEEPVLLITWLLARS